MNNKTITVIDQTIREGMQYRGVVFSKEQRAAILDFQEELGVDICQAGYASAHITEQENIRMLFQITQKKDYDVRIACMGKASVNDVDALVNTGVADFHLHAHILRTADETELAQSYDRIMNAVQELKKKVSDSKISIALLDIGTSSPELLERTTAFFINDLEIDILSLPDTSGIMSPDTFYDAIKKINKFLSVVESPTALSQISVHCHNDLGMASANTLMGVKAGATVVELSALGIGERNGIGDLFTVGRFLKNQGYNIRLDTENIKTFRSYYQYVSDICKAQTGVALLNYNTPFFGDAARTHVAGTHAGSGFGLFKKREGLGLMSAEYPKKTGIFPKDHNIKESSCLKEEENLDEEYYLNVLCGRHLVKKYLESIAITCPPDQLHNITEQIKSQSAMLGRRLEKEEILAICGRT